ncbi:MAG: proline dehydrogenase [Planctomycetes bacterium]|jgi:proline dehydrogenase|nr:proline dehydrogenase [Planctomycetota bacterium]MBT4028318.1 proline dehydrogenase [Planctomycetota bacterium]MBT4560889.1 proline dehydrogenase [Planctomycetota bacterium]MBT5101957.1 proline dehydrogenase [Planctomycetota bacterium]MBT7319371.1 proline dehydrogenase [Planctomycetota bacterium]
MSIFDRIAAASVPLLPRFIVSRVSRRYIAGETCEDALRAGARLQAKGYRVTYDILGESVSSFQGVESMLAEYEALLQALVDRGLERNVSTKPTQLGLLLDPSKSREATQRLTDMVGEAEAFLRYEMEDSPTVDNTLQLFSALQANKLEQVGCVLQSMLFRTEQDARNLVAQHGAVNVRLVKGIYVEPASIAFQLPAEVNSSYLRTAKIILEGGGFLAIATHDAVLANQVLELAREIPGALERIEIQVLLGVQEAFRSKMRDQGIPVRVYVPYGEMWYPYVTRRLRKNPKLARYALLGLFRKRESLSG